MVLVLLLLLDEEEQALSYCGSHATAAKQDACMRTKPSSAQLSRAGLPAINAPTAEGSTIVPTKPKAMNREMAELLSGARCRAISIPAG